MHSVFFSATFKKQFRALRNKTVQARIKEALKELEKEPLKSRPGADIKKIKDTKPVKHRIRVGDYRIIYRVEKHEVKVIELFKRGRGYRE